MRTTSRLLFLVLFSVILGQISAFGDSGKPRFFCLKGSDEPSVISIKACGPDAVSMCQQKVDCVTVDDQNAKSIVMAYNNAHKDQTPLTSYDQIHDDLFILNIIRGQGPNYIPATVNCMPLPAKSSEGPLCPAPNDCKDDTYFKPVQAKNDESRHIGTVTDLSTAPPNPFGAAGAN
jgi:hypothetical protein